MDACGHRLDRWQVDVVVSVHVRLVVGRQHGAAAGAAFGEDLAGMIGIWGQGAGHAGSALAALPGRRLGPIGLLAARRRHRRVVGRLGRDGKPGLKRGHPSSQRGILLQQRQHQRLELILAERIEALGCHPELESEF